MSYTEKLKVRFRKKPTRRAAMLMLAGFLTVAGLHEEAKAFIFSGGVAQATPPPGGVITMLGALNTTTINGPAAALTNEICRPCLVFPDNDSTGCPVGTYPVVYPHGSGTPVAAQGCIPLQKWASGRIKHAMLPHIIPSLAATAGVTDATVDQGNATTALFDIQTVSGTPGSAGISQANATSYLSLNGDITGSVTGPDGIVYSVSALAGFAGSSTVSGYMTAATNWGKLWASDCATCFVVSIPFANGGNRLRILQAFMYLIFYHVSGTIVDVECRLVHENGCMGVSDPVSGVLNSNLPYQAANWSINGVARWSRASITPNATLNVPFGNMGALVSGGNALARYKTVQSSVYVTSVLDGFTFNQNNLGRPIYVGDQVIWPISNGSMQAVQVNSSSADFTSPPTITNTGSATFLAVISGNPGSVIAVVRTNSGTVGTLGWTGGGGTSLSMSAIAAASTAPSCMVQDPGAVCNLQSGTGGTLTLNGRQCVTIAGTTKAYVRYAGTTRVWAYSEQNNTGVTLTINGVHPDGTTTPVVVTGPAAFGTVDCGSWDTITSITRSGTSNLLCVGVGGFPAGTNGLMNVEGSPARGVTCNITATAGNWSVYGGMFAANSWNVEEIWYNQTPRHYTSFQNQYLIDSRCFLNYQLAEMKASPFLASSISGDVASVATYAKSTNTVLYPDGADFNKPYYYNWGTLGSFGFTLQESISGENAGLGADSWYDTNWLAYGGFNGWSVIRANSQRIFNIRNALRDETTGFAFNPATYPNMADFGYVANSASTSASPCLYLSPDQSGGSGFGATFAWQQNDSAHCNTSSCLTYWLRGDPEIFCAIQHEGSMRWMLLGNGAGQGVNRAWNGTPGTGPTQMRVTAQSAIKSIGKPLIQHPSELPSGFFAPKSNYKTVVDNGFNNTTTGNGLYNRYVVGPDLNGAMPSAKGNFHMWASASPGGAATGYQLPYACLNMVALLENGELSSQGQAFLEWASDCTVQYMSNPTQINPRTVQQTEWVLGVDGFHSPPATVNGMAGLWAAMDYGFPAESVGGGPVSIGFGIPSNLTLGATTGTGIACTFSAATAYTDFVGAYIAGDFLPGGISVQTVSPWNVTSNGHGLPIGVATSAIFGPSGLTTPPTPLQFGRTIYWLVASDANTFKVYTDQAATNQVQFSAAGTGGLICALGLARITAVPGGPTVASSSITVDILSNFKTTNQATNWVLSILPPSANNTTKMNLAPQGGTGVNAYVLLIRTCLAANAKFPGNSAQAIACWNNAKTWGQNENIGLNSSTNNYVGQGNRVIGPR